MADGRKVSASQLLEHFMFPPQMQYTYVSKLSGGEKRRLYLLTVLIKNPNFLILDEPTNDLDLLTLNKLEEFLLQFKGCLMIVSHDRYFMDKLVDHLFVFKGNAVIEDHYCSYSDYRKIASKSPKEVQSKPEKKTLKKAESDQPKKRTFSERIEYDKLEKEINLLEKEKAEIENALMDSSMEYDLMIEKSNRLGVLMELIDGKSFRWMELDEIGS